MSVLSLPRDEAPTTTGGGRRLAVAAAASVLALGVSSLAPLLGPLLVALLLGAVVANVAPLRDLAGSAPATDRLLLRAGVVLLGLQVAGDDVLALGPGVLVVVLVTVVATYAAAQACGRSLGVDPELTTLVAAGFSICGAAAIAAVDASLRARARHVALAVALVTVFGTVMIGVVTVGGDLLGLDERQQAVWAGASIHEVAQVLAAGSLVGGPLALATATTVKLARVALLAPAQAVSARACRREADRGGPVVPLFVLGFGAAVALRSTGVLPAGVLHATGAVTTLLLGAAMFGLGTGLAARDLWPVPGRVLLLACVTTAVAALTSLALVAVLV